MPAIKEKAFELIEKMPDDKVVYIVNIMENLDSLFNGTEPDEEKMQAYEMCIRDSNVAVHGSEQIRINQDKRGCMAWKKRRLKSFWNSADLRN